MLTTAAVRRVYLLEYVYALRHEFSYLCKIAVGEQLGYELNTGNCSVKGPFSRAFV